MGRGGERVWGGLGWGGFLLQALEENGSGSVSSPSALLFV